MKNFYIRVYQQNFNELTKNFIGPANKRQYEQKKSGQKHFLSKFRRCIVRPPNSEILRPLIQSYIIKNCIDNYSKAVVLLNFKMSVYIPTSK